jgi:hypothetical protein
MTENELRRAAAAAAQREQDRHAQYLQDHQRRRDQYVQEQRDQRIATLRSALHATFGAELEGDLGGSYGVLGDLCLMDAVYDVRVADVALRIRQVRDEVMEQWVCEAVACGTWAVVQIVPERVEVNRDRLLLALHAVYGGSDVSSEGMQRGWGMDTCGSDGDAGRREQ